MFEVTNLKTEETGTFDTLSEAREFASGMTHYGIWEGGRDSEGEFVYDRRVEFCDPYEGDDDQVKIMCGVPCQSDSIRN